MPKKAEMGWSLANCWLLALEETARDFHGHNPRPICERAYEHVSARWIQTLEEDYGITTPEGKSIKEAVENYIKSGVEAGLFSDPSQYELNQTGPHRLEIKVLECPYRKSCEIMIEDQVQVPDLTCARIGCFRAAAEILAGIPLVYQVTAFCPDGYCEGTIERR